MSATRTFATLAAKYATLLVAALVAGHIDASAQQQKKVLDALANHAANYAKTLAQQTPPDAEQAWLLLDEAKTASDQGRWTAAVEKLELAASSPTPSYPVFLRLSRAWLEANESDRRGQAAAYLAYKAARSDEERIEALTVLEQLLRKEGQTLGQRFRDDSANVQTLNKKLAAAKEVERAALLKQREALDRSRVDFVRRYQALNETSLEVAALFAKLLTAPRQEPDTDPNAMTGVNVFYLLGGTKGDDEQYLASEPLEESKKEPDDASGSSTPETDTKSNDRQPITWSTSERGANACATFSLPLRPAAALYKKEFAEVKIGEDHVDFDVDVRGSKICFSGLAHRREYTFVFKKGLPSQTDFRLQTTQTIQSPSPQPPSIVKFDSRAYIMPSTSSGGVSVTLKHVNSVRMSLYRISDRNSQREAFYGTIGTNFVNDVVDFSQNRAEKLWTGLLGPRDKPLDLKTEVPVLQILEARRQWIRSVDPSEERLEGRDPLAKIDMFEEARFHGDAASYQASDASSWEPGLYVLIADRLPDTNDEAAIARYYDLDVDLNKREETAEKVGLRLLGQSSETIKPTAVQWIAFSDIGLTYYKGASSVYAIARSLRSGAPMVGTEIQLLSAGNRILGSAKTNEIGLAEFPAGLTRGTGSNRLATVFAYSEQDFNLIHPERDVIDLTAHGMGGRRPPQTADAYLYTDRGIYRPGEVINLFLLVRDPDGKAIVGGTPLQLRTKGPTGAQLAEPIAISADQLASGGTGVRIPISRTALLGTGEIEVLLADKVIGSSTFQVAHFQRDRARIEVFQPSERLANTEGVASLKGEVKANYLYGGRSSSGLYVEAPASALSGEVQVLLSPATSPFAGCYTDFSFGETDQTFAPHLSRHNIGPTGSDGRLKYEIDIPGVPSTNLPIRANLSATLFDAAGKLGTRNTQFVLKREMSWLGVRRRSADKEQADGRMAVALDIVALTSENALRTDNSVEFDLYREKTRFVWYDDQGKWNYVADTEKVHISAGVATLATAAANTANACHQPSHSIEQQLEVGTYWIAVRDKTGAQTAVRIIVGASSTSARAMPEVLPVRSHKTDFQPGEQATFKFEPPFDGELLVAFVRGDNIVEWNSTIATGGAAEVSLTIPRAWMGTELHLLATLFRSNTDGTIERGPARAVGVFRFRVTDLEEALTVEFDGTPRKIASGAELPIRISARYADGRPYNGKAMVGLMAVDQGVLSLTDHAPPAPHSHFFGARRMTLELLDNYGRIILSDKRPTRSGGDEVIGFLSRILGDNVRPDRVLSRMYLDPGGVMFENGIARINPGWGDISNFDGTMQLTALVWTDNSVGAAATEILVRNALVATLGVPRYIAPGDEVEVPLQVDNLESLNGRFSFSLTGPYITRISDGNGVEVRDRATGRFSLDLNRGDKSLVWVAISVPKSGAVGQLDYELNWAIENTTLALANTAKRFSITVHEPAPPTTALIGTRRLATGEELKLSDDIVPPELRKVLADYRIQVRFAPTPMLLAARDRFAPPSEVIGSLEALVWTGMTLLAREPTAENGSELRQIVQDILSLQQQDGLFSDYLPQYQSEEEAENAGGEKEAESKSKTTDAWGDEVHERTGGDAPLWRTALVADLLSRYPDKRDVDRPLARAIEIMTSEFRTAFTNRLLDTVSSDICRLPVLYAGYVLAKAGALTDDDIAQLRETCYTDRAGALERVIIAAASFAFGRTDTAKLILTNLPHAPSDAQPNSIGLLDADQRTAMYLAFLSRADAPDSVIESTLQDFINRRRDKAGPLAPSADAWLANTVTSKKDPKLNGNVEVEILDGDVQANDQVETRNADEVSTKFITPDLLVNGRLRAINQSNGAVSATIFLRRSTPAQPPQADDADLSVKRRIIDENGAEISGDEPKLKQNTLYFVVLEGKSQPAGAQSKADTSDEDSPKQKLNELVVSDYLPAGVEVASKSAFEAARANPRLEQIIGHGLGRLYYAQALDDRYVAIVRPSERETDHGMFRIAYAVRPTLKGRLALPATTVEDLRKPDRVSISTSGGQSLIVGSVP